MEETWFSGDHSFVLRRDDLLGSFRFRDASVGVTTPPAVAILRGSPEGDTLLRVAAYPTEKLAYCGLWYRDDLLLGGSTTALNAVGDQLFLAGNIEMLGRSVLRLGISITWAIAQSLNTATVINGAAEIVDEHGYGCERLAISSLDAADPMSSTAEILQFPAARSERVT